MIYVGTVFTISNNGGISKEDIERMKADAEKYKEEDKKKAEDANFINQSETMALMIEKTLNDENLKDKLTDEDKEAVKPALEKVKEAVSKRDVNEVKSAMDELNKVWEPIVKKIYPQQDQNIDPNMFGGMGSNPENPFTKTN